MKKKQTYKILGTIILTFISLPLFAQTNDERNATIGDAFTRQKDFGGFILDMGSMLNASSLVLPPIQLNHIPLTYDFEMTELLNPSRPNAFTFQPQITFDRVSLPASYGMYGLYPNIGNGPVQWQSATYKLNNGIRITTYGEYDADGNKVYNPHRLPWEKNRFNAAFELKSANGKFGFRLEVHGGRNYLY